MQIEIDENEIKLVVFKAMAEVTLGIYYCVYCKAELIYAYYPGLWLTKNKSNTLSPNKSNTLSPEYCASRDEPYLDHVPYLETNLIEKSSK